MHMGVENRLPMTHARKKRIAAFEFQSTAMSARTQVLVKAFETSPDHEGKETVLDTIVQEVELDDFLTLVCMGFVESLVGFVRDEKVTASGKRSGICLLAQIAAFSYAEENVILGTGAIEAVIEALPTADQPNSILDEDIEEVVFEAMGEICVRSMLLRDRCILGGFVMCVDHLLRFTECAVPAIGWQGWLALAMVQKVLHHGPFLGSEGIRYKFMDVLRRWEGPEFPVSSPISLMDVTKWEGGMEVVRSSGILSRVVNAIRDPLRRDTHHLLGIIGMYASPGEMGACMFRQFPNLAHDLLVMMRYPEPNYGGLKVLADGGWMMNAPEAGELEQILTVVNVLWESVGEDADLEPEGALENQAKLLARVIPKLGADHLTDLLMTDSTFIPEMTKRLDSQNRHIVRYSLAALLHVLIGVEKAPNIDLKQKFDTAGIPRPLAHIAADRALPYSIAAMAGAILARFFI